VESDTYNEVVKRLPLLANAYGIQITDKSQGIDGVWVRGESLDGPGITDATVLHEALHQAPARKIGLYMVGEVRAVERQDTISDASDMRRAYDDLVRLRDHVTKEYMRQRDAALEEGRDIGIDVMKMYVAVSDLREMVSYGFTDKDIHDFMKSIPGVLKGRSA